MIQKPPSSAPFTNAKGIIAQGWAQWVENISRLASRVLTTETKHNDIEGRDATDAHPIASITDLQGTINALEATDLVIDTKATTALATANSAQGTANSALNTANDAVAIGNNALTTAQTAQTEVDNLENVVANLHLELKANTTESSTGLLTWDGTKFAIVDATHIRIGAGTGQIVDTSGVVTQVTWAENTNLLDAYVGSTSNTYYMVSSAGAFVQQSTYPTPTQMRSHIYLGFTGHAPVGTILAITAEPSFAINEMSQVRDIFDNALRHINDDIAFSANGANLNLNRSAGSIYGLGLGVSTSLTDPSRVAISGGTAVTFQYRTRTGVATGNLTAVDTANYDVGGVVTSIPSSNKWTNQRLYVSPSGINRLQLGQAYYGSLAEALAAVQTETFVTYPPFKENFVLVGILSVKNNATTLNTSATATFVPVSKFGEILGGSAGTSTTTLQQAYENGTEPEIVTNSIRGALSFKRGSGADTDNVIEIQNGAGTTTASVKGDGTTDVGSLTAKGVAVLTHLPGYTAIAMFNNSSATSFGFYSDSSGNNGVAGTTLDMNHTGNTRILKSSVAQIEFNGSSAIVSVPIALATYTELLSDLAGRVRIRPVGGVSYLELFSSANDVRLMAYDRAGASYQDASIRAKSISLNTSGTSRVDVTDSSVKSNIPLVLTQKTPASASAAGIAGEICADANYIYHCTATNTWKRVAIATW